jgi:hypothetical protein
LPPNQVTDEACRYITRIPAGSCAMLDGYVILNIFAVVIGPLVFLRIVSHDIESVREYQRRLEERERKAQQRRRANMSEAA